MYAASSALALALALIAAAPADAAMPTISRSIERIAAPFRRDKPAPPPAAPPAAPAGERMKLVCVIGARQPVQIRPDPIGPSYGVMVGDVEHMSWLPARNQVRLRFTRHDTAAAGDLPAGACAFAARPVAADEPDEVGFPVDPQAWEYGWMNNQPLLMPAGSRMDVLLTAGRTVTFTVTRRRASDAESYWWAEAAPEVTH